MKSFCFGSLYAVLYQARAQKVTQPILCSALFDAFGAYGIDSRDGSLPGHLKIGKDNVPPDVIADAQTCNIDKVEENFKANVVGLIRPELRKHVVCAIRDLLRNDDVSDDINIGITSGFTKSDIISKPVFTFSTLLANVFQYAIANVTNKDCSGFLSKIKKDYILTFDAEAASIVFDTEASPVMSDFQTTMNPKGFDEAFDKISDITVSGLSNPTTVHLYQLDVRNYSFDFRFLKKHLIENIGRYVYSRAEMNNFKASGSMETIAFRAMNLLSKSSKSGDTWNENLLGEILLYIFLEKELGAPKVMSKIEFGNNGTSHSDGIHLNLVAGSPTPYHQLVFGASDIVDNLEVAIDRAFDKISAIETNYENEYSLVEHTAFSNPHFNDSSTDYLKRILHPGSRRDLKPEMAFGVFLGYNVSEPHDGMNNRQYNEHLKERLKQDISEAKPYICEKIKQLHLDGYSFYFYVLPFNNAEQDKQDIMTELSGGDF